MGTPINHGTDNDKNIIVQVTRDVAGRVTSQRDPRGYLTEYEYDQLGRHIRLTNPLSKEWETGYSYLSGGGTRTTLTDPNGVNTQRDFDRLGRLQSIQYGNPSNTPDVLFGYDVAGNRTQMTEYGGANFTSPVRGTAYSYDSARRLTQVDFDTDGDSSVEETVSYDYDVAGTRTRMTLPGGLEIDYQYDSKGQLVALTDWDDQTTQFAYDNAGRLIASKRANGQRSRYRFDAAGRLRVLRHTKDFQTLAHFAYEVDGRGNRTQALECVPHPSTTNDTTYPYDDSSIVYRGSWTDDDPYMLTTAWSASMKLAFFGDEFTFTISEGPDRSIFDVYINESLWRSIDGYAASVADRPITVELDGEGPHLFEIRNRKEKNLSSSGYAVRFKELVVPDLEYDLHTIEYVYDGISRLREARYNPGVNVDAADGDLLRRYQFAYDLAGNRTGRTVHIGGVQDSALTYTYNVANQLVNDGTNTLTYDDNGNLTSDGVNSYTWDRANRLLSMGGVSNQYDGEGHRIQKTVGVDVTKYLLDLQPGLSVALSANKNDDITRFVHTPMGIHAQEDQNGMWTWAAQDGLGSVRLEANNALSVLGMRHLDPFGNPFGAQGTMLLPFVFTGEIRDENGLQDHRARQYSSQLGIFPSLDPFEGLMQRPMSLNGYSWVEGNVPNGAVGELIFHNRYSYANGNPVNRVDPSGMFGKTPGQWDTCWQAQDPCQECNEKYLSPYQDTNIWGPRYNAAWLACMQVCQSYGGVSPQSVWQLPMNDAALTLSGCLSRRVTSTYVPCSRDVNLRGQSGGSYAVYAPNTNGVVWFSGIGGSGLGNVVILRYSVDNLPSQIQNLLPSNLEGGASLFIQYAHLSSDNVSSGDAIPEGLQVGLSGATGSDYDAHLDISVIWIPDKAARDAVGVYFAAAPDARQWDNLTTNINAYNARWTIDPLDLWPEMRWSDESRDVPSDLCQPAECKVYNP